MKGETMTDPDWVEFKISYGRKVTIRASHVLGVSVLLDPSGEKDKERAGICYLFGGKALSIRLEEYYEDVTAALKEASEKSRALGEPALCSVCRRALLDERIGEC
jgi:hypothetical protein